MLMRVVVWVVLGLLFVSYLTLAARGMQGGPGDHNVSAISACETKIVPRLVAPSTAKFSGWTNSTTSNGPDDSIIVSAYVDSQNSFGAMIRTPYTCTIYKDRSIGLSGI
jgi:hypothetical protein